MGYEILEDINVVHTWHKILKLYFLTKEGGEGGNTKDRKCSFIHSYFKWFKVQTYIETR
jgi:hypothetical protein